MEEEVDTIAVGAEIESVLSMESPGTYHDRDLRPCVVSVDDDITNLEVQNENPLLGFFRLNVLALTLGGCELLSIFDMNFQTNNRIQQLARRVLFRIFTGIGNSDPPQYYRVA